MHGLKLPRVLTFRGNKLLANSFFIVRSFGSLMIMSCVAHLYIISSAELFIEPRSHGEHRETRRLSVKPLCHCVSVVQKNMNKELTVQVCDATEAELLIKCLVQKNLI
jgi:hypothetical protein